MKKSFILLSSAVLFVALTFGSCGTGQKPADDAKTECCENKGDKECCAKKDSCKHEHSDSTKCANKKAACDTTKCADKKAACDTTKCAGKHKGEKKHEHGKDCKH